MSTPAVVYSVNHRLDGGGMGTSVTEMLVGLHQARLLKQAIVSSSRTTRLPPTVITQQGMWGRIQKRLALYDPSRWWANYIESWLFDRWTTRVMQPATVFSSWTGICTVSLRTAKTRGMKTVLGLGSAHPRTLVDLLNKENARWGQPLQTFTPHLQQIERELVQTDTILVQSRFSEHTLLAHGLPASKIIRLPLGVDVARFTPAPPPSGSPFRALYLGQVLLRKGVQYLLAAWEQLGWHDAELWIAGHIAREARSMLAAYAHLPGLRLLGHVPDQRAVLQQAHTLVMPSVEDGFGLVLLEALACGLPVIVSANVGAADLITHGESGFVVAYNDVNGYAHALETLRRQAELRAVFSQAGQAIARQQSWDNYRAQLLLIYNSL